ncbi:MAG: hypothetical protein WKF89_14540, partial [Chitinophagaceae bacterium]
MKKWLPVADIVLIIVLALFPLLGNVFPYRLNIFLSYEGAYRLYEGHLPYKDFGIPMGYMYWVIPGMFFKIFGPYMMSLIKAQVFINIIAGLSFRAIIRNLSVRPGIRFLSVLLFCISYSFLNYWPWYNHTVIVFELVALALLTRFLFTESRWKFLWLVLSGVFTFFSFFTKQDAGAMGFLVCFFIVAYNAVIEKKWMPLPVFIGSFFLTGLVMIAPFLKYGFGYWFNHGQLPHTSRFSLEDFTGEFFNNSQWLKFYLIVTALLLMATVKRWKTFFYDRKKMVFTLLTFGILVEASIFQVTSYIPADNNIFFHSFAIVFILVLLSELSTVNFESVRSLLAGVAGIMLWWSSIYWKYIEKYIFTPSGPVLTNVVNKNTYLQFKPDTSDVPMDQWRTIPLKAFHKILLPGPTVDGINRLLQMDLVKGNKNLRVLNMTELTPLAREMPFELEKASFYPLWYHKGVGMFQKETDMFCERIRSDYY